MKTSILSVDEFDITKLELMNILKDLNIHIISVKDEDEALDILNDERHHINAIIWTINSVDFQDFKAIKILKKAEACKNIPIIIISKFTDRKHIIKAIESGAAEFIARPYDKDMVLNKICKTIGVPLDRTTGVNIDEDIVTYNFSEMFNKEIKAASRGHYALSIMIASVASQDSSDSTIKNMDDTVKLINRVIRTKLRETDASFQYGTNNIIILLPFTDKAGAKSVEEKINDLFNNHSVIQQKSEGYSMIITSVSFPQDGKIRDKLLEKLEDTYNNNIKTCSQD